MCMSTPYLFHLLMMSAWVSPHSATTDDPPVPMFMCVPCYLCEEFSRVCVCVFPEESLRHRVCVYLLQSVLLVPSISDCKSKPLLVKLSISINNSISGSFVQFEAFLLVKYIRFLTYLQYVISVFILYDVFHLTVLFLLLKLLCNPSCC